MTAIEKGNLDDAWEECQAMVGQDPVRLWATGEARTAFEWQMGDCHENPAWSGVDDDARFRVVIPASGGMDSMTAWLMAYLAGYPTVLVYVDTGAHYTEREIAAVQRTVSQIAAPEGVPFYILRKPDVPYVHFDYVDLGRNAIIVWEIARMMQVSGWWGEVWFGNTAEWQETPVTGGDKSCRWFTTMQQVLTLKGFDVRLVNPLAGMQKGDLVDWWAARELTEDLANTRSCYDGESVHGCGRCRSCFRKMIAFRSRGAGDLLQFDTEDWREHARLYWHDRGSSTSITMCVDRCREADAVLIEMGLTPEKVMV